MVRVHLAGAIHTLLKLTVLIGLAPFDRSCTTLVAAAPTAKDTYAPRRVQCPANPLVRQAGTVSASNQALHPSEADYIAKRQQKQVAAVFRSYLQRLKTGYDIQRLIAADKEAPIVGLAVSGGGFRAAQYGAGVFQALDGRDNKAVKAGTGGVLQLASYMTGLSGGAWFVSSLAINNMPQMHDLVFGSAKTGSPRLQGWFLERNLALPAGPLETRDNKDFYDNIKANIQLKKDAGFAVSVTDVWGLALATHFGPGGTTAESFYKESPTINNAPTLWSDIKRTKAFKSQCMPFPIIVANSLPEDFRPLEKGLDDVFVPLEQPVYEFNPYEMGSFDPALARFMQLEHVGTKMKNGKPHSKECIEGFTNFGFTIGTSSSLFNAIIQTVNATLYRLSGEDNDSEDPLRSLLRHAGEKIRDTKVDIANYPNPFFSTKAEDKDKSETLRKHLALVDGGEGGANVPLDPLLVKARKVETIVAIDGSSDTDEGWPDGESLRKSYARAAKLPKGYQTLPKVPSKQTFLDDKLNERPSFFGCDVSEKEFKAGMPLIIYLPNAPVEDGYDTSTSTFKLGYKEKDTQSFLDSVWTVTTTGAQKGSVKWSTCLACALADRTRQRRNMARSKVCGACFRRYCWDEEKQQ